MRDGDGCSPNGVRPDLRSRHFCGGRQPQIARVGDLPQAGVVFLAGRRFFWGEIGIFVCTGITSIIGRKFCGLPGSTSGSGCFAVQELSHFCSSVRPPVGRLG